MTFWPLTNSDFPTDQTFHQFHDLYTELDLHRIMSGFHGAFATGVASQQGTLTLPDTWFRPPFWDLLMHQLLRPNSSNLPCLYSTFHLEYPLVLSRFCLQHGKNHQLVQKRKTMVLYPHIFPIYLSWPPFFNFMPSRNLLYRTKFTRQPHPSNTMPAVAILISRWTTDGKVAVSNPTSGMIGCTSDGKEFKDVFGFPDPYRDIRSTWVFGRM